MHLFTSSELVLTTLLLEKLQLNTCHVLLSYSVDEYITY